jgi:hypothetical protein
MSSDDGDEHHQTLRHATQTILHSHLGFRRHGMIRRHDAHARTHSLSTTTAAAFHCIALFQLYTQTMSPTVDSSSSPHCIALHFRFRCCS